MDTAACSGRIYRSLNSLGYVTSIGTILRACLHKFPNIWEQSHDSRGQNDDMRPGHTEKCENVFVRATGVRDLCTPVFENDGLEGV